MNINDVAKQFTNFYYTTFDSNRSTLGALYRDTSMLSFEGSLSQGTADIIGKLTSLPFQKVQHKVTTMDTQPSAVNGAIVVSITGLLLVDDGDKPLNFSQVFQLVPDGAGSYYVHNDIFRLNYG